jgi:DDE superfamily endonuclease
MHPVILPDSFLALLALFEPCFHAPSYRNFVTVVAGWVQCLGRRTVTAVVLAAGAAGERHISVYHRFFSRARWSLDALGRVLFGLAIAWCPAEGPLIVIVDDTLCRKGGKGISGASMHHDPLRSTRRKPFFSFGHVWVVLALWVPLPLGDQRGFALPILFRLYRSSKRGGRADSPARRTRAVRAQAAQADHATSPRPTKLELARELVSLVAGWAGERPVQVVADSLYAGRTMLEARPANVHLISRLRMDAALWTVPSKRRLGQRGRSRRRGVRLPSPAALTAARRQWQSMTLTLYGRQVTTQVFVCRALWYVALRDQPVRIVIVRDPSGRRADEAFFCTDLRLDAAAILEAYARRWTLEVTFHDAKQSLGFEDPQQQSAQAVRQTAPLAGLVYSFVLLWAADRVRQGATLHWVQRPWYPTKATPSFPDLLTALRVAGWRCYIADPVSSLRHHQKSPTSWPDAVLATA